MNQDLKGQNPETTSLFQCFKRHLKTLIEGQSLEQFLPRDPDGDFINPLVDAFITNYLNVEQFIESITFDTILNCINRHPLGKSSDQHLVVAPCSPSFEPILEELSHQFNHISFLDTHRAGMKIGKKTILHPNEMTYSGKELCIILTRNTEAINCYQNQFGHHNCLNFLGYHIHQKRDRLAPGTCDFVKKINQGEKNLLFASARPLGTLTSTIQCMTKEGYNAYWLGAEEIKSDHQTAYSTPKTKDMGFSDYTIGSLIDVLYIFSKMDRGTALFHFEALYPPAWDFKRVAICYAGTLAIIRTIKESRAQGSRATLALYMYDAIKPGVKNYHAGEACGNLYKMMMVEADAVAFSSYTEPFGDFVENSIGKQLVRCHCHRYQIVPRQRQKRLQDGFHIAIISVMLEEFWEPSRMGLVGYIRDIISQGIHIHYYVGPSLRERVLQFKMSLPDLHQDFFHIHAPIHDPEKLAFDLSQYHAGWSLFNMQIFCDMTSNLTDQFTRDAMDMFTPTTLPSVIWSCAAAGLPIICNRSMQGVVDMLPKGMTLPLTLSELGSLKSHLNNLNWDEIDRIPLDELDISNQIYKLYDFLDGLNEKARCRNK